MRTVGIVTNRSVGVPSDAASTRQSLDFQERTLSLTLNQLLGKQWSLGARYQISDADLDGWSMFLELPYSTELRSTLLYRPAEHLYTAP